MKPNSHLSSLLKFAYHAAGQTLPPSPARSSHSTKNSPTHNKSRSNLSPNNKSNISLSHSPSARKNKEMPNKSTGITSSRKLRDSVDQNASSSRIDKNNLGVKLDGISQKESQKVLSSDRRSKNSGNIEEGKEGVIKLVESQRKSGRSTERLKSDRSSGKGLNVKQEKESPSKTERVEGKLQRGTQTTDRVNEGKEKETVVKKSEDNKMNKDKSGEIVDKEKDKDMGKMKEEKNASEKSLGEKEVKEKEGGLSKRSEEKRNSGELVDTKRSKLEERKSSIVASEKSITEPNSSIKATSIKEKEDIDERGKDKEGFNSDMSPIVKQNVDYSPIENELEALLEEERRTNVNHYEKIHQDGGLQKKMKEYRERNPYPCYNYTTFKGIISRKDRSKSKHKKLKSLAKPDTDSSVVHQTSFGALKETEVPGTEGEDHKKRRILTEEPFELMKINNKVNQSKEEQVNEYMRGRKKLAPIENARRSVDNSFSYEQNNVSGIEKSREKGLKVNHVRENIMRHSSIKRMESLEREREEKEREREKEKEKEIQRLMQREQMIQRHKEKQRLISLDNSFVEQKTVQPVLKLEQLQQVQQVQQAQDVQQAQENKEKPKVDSQMGRNTVVLEKIKTNYKDYLQGAKMIKKPPRKHSKAKAEKLLNIKNIYGLEDYSDKLEVLLKAEKRGQRNGSTEDRDSAERSVSPIHNPVLSNQISANAITEVVETYTTTEPENGKKAEAQKTVKTMDGSRMNSKDKIDGESVVREMFRIRESPSGKLSSQGRSPSNHSNDVSLVNQSNIEHGMRERGSSIGYVNLFEKRSSSLARNSRLPFGVEVERSPGPKYDLSSYKGFPTPERILKIEDYSKRGSKTDLDVKSTNRSYTVLRQTDRDPSSQRSTVISGKGVNFGKAKRQILCETKSEVPGPGKYEMPTISKNGVKFGSERKSLKFFIPKLKDITGANPVL